MSGIVYGLLWVVFRAVGRLCFRYRPVGSQNIPRTGGVLVAANHASFLDIPLLGCGIRRRVWFLGRHDLFPIPVLNTILQALGWIPMRQGRLDREAFGKAIGLIKAGKAVVIFPEGGRTSDGHLRPGRPGLGVIVAQTRCPVVPAYIKGTYEALPIGAWRPRFRPVTVTYGEPIDFSDGVEPPASKAFYRHVSRTVMAKIAELGQVPPPDRLHENRQEDRAPAGRLATRSYNAE